MTRHTTSGTRAERLGDDLSQPGITALPLVWLLARDAACEAWPPSQAKELTRHDHP